MSRHYYSREEIEWLKNNVKGISLKELTERFNETFKLKVSEKAIGHIKFIHGMKSELKFNGYADGVYVKPKLEHAFKKGHLPHTTKPIGSESVDSYGFVIVKIDERNTWKLKHHLIYEQHYGEIPKGDKVIFLDGNTRNFDINNLCLLSRNEQLTMNRSRAEKSCYPDITRARVIIAKLECKLSDLKKHK